jgi:hypothetical protein
MDEELKARLIASGLSNDQVLMGVLRGLAGVMKQEDFIDMCNKLAKHFKEKPIGESK